MPISIWELEHWILTDQVKWEHDIVIKLQKKGETILLLRYHNQLESEFVALAFGDYCSVFFSEVLEVYW